METFVFFTKGRSPKRYRAENHIEACEKFYADHPDFHLNELLDIKIAKPNRKKNSWLEISKSHKHTGVN